MNILQLLASSSFITLNKNVIKAVGLEEALILGELSSEYDYWLKRDELNNGWFFSTVENIEENTTLNDYKQRKAIDSLLKLNVLETKLKGIPAKRYFKINEEQVIKLLNIQLLNDLNSSSQKFKELDIKNLKTNNNINNKNKINNNIKENKEKELTEEFNQLWELYPNKKGKANALKSYLKACKNGSIYEQVKQGIENYKAEIKAKETPIEYIKHGSTWFNQQCWNDEYETKPQYPQQKQYGREDTSFSIELAEQKAQAFLRGEIDICGKRR